MLHRSPRNRILSSLSDDQQARISSSAEHVQFKTRNILFDLDQPITSVYFPVEGVVSLVNILADGSAVESASIGYEGMVGLPIFLGATTMSAQAFIQVPGSGYRLSIEQFLLELERGTALRTALSKYTQAMMTLLAQNAACNRAHSIDQRCARWLLITRDRVTSDTFELPQRFLALMAGGRMATINVAAAVLEKAGLIHYANGVLNVLNRVGLEGAACECYAIVRNEFARLQGGATMANPLADVVVSEGGLTTVDAVEIMRLNDN